MNYTANRSIPKSFCIGHPHMDDQHQALIETIRQIEQDLVDGAPPVSHCKSLVDGFIEHTQDEECLMRESNYPHTVVHIRHHQKLLEKMNTVLLNCQDGANCDACTVQDLTRIVIDDMIKADSDFKNYLAQKGLVYWI
ncbi:MAG: bacteriohemerythrin [Magnetospiraceae bacterium]